MSLAKVSRIMGRALLGHTPRKPPAIRDPLRNAGTLVDAATGKPVLIGDRVKSYTVTGWRAPSTHTGLVFVVNNLNMPVRMFPEELNLKIIKHNR